ncbi:hypothetical protein [Vagococcus fluvialis]|uniref:hypothetical protein n=1 Tax=Vagococcus fluvialis TaxID=2738 RepID=UPI0022E051A0|nr:hypothetical protein [Vagococcus fluvialis]
MLNVSNAFNEAFKSDLREVKMRIKINDVTYTDEDIVSFNFNAGSIVGESFAIGSTYANSIKLTLCKIVEGLKQLDEVTPEMGIVLPNGSTEWVKLGTFIISEEVNPDRNENRTSLECTDKMIMLDDIYESELNYPAKIIDVALEIANLAGVEVDKVSFGRLMENTIQKPIGYTFRQAIGLIAQFEAGYACFDRNGLLAIRQLEDKDYQVTPNEYFQNGLTKNELKFRPAGIQVKVSDTSEDDKVLKIGNEKGSVIRLENKVMTEQLLRLVYEKVKDINYYPYSLKWRGNPAIEVGDWLLVNDTRGNMFKVPNLSYSMEYKGGLTATSTVETVASNEVRFGYKKILDQVVELVENSIKDLDGNVIYYGVEEPPNPKEGDTWFKYVDSDTEIWVYEKVAEPDIFDWVFKISSAVDGTIKEKIEQLEEDSKQQQLDIEKALTESELARKEAFDSTVISRQAERDALNALAQGDKNKTEITKLDGQQKLTNTKVEGNTANILNLQTDSEKLSLSIGKVQADVDGMEIGGRNYFSQEKLTNGKLESWIVPSYLFHFELQPNTEYTVSSNVPGYVGDTSKTNIYFNGSISAGDGVWLNKPVTKKSDNDGYLFIAVPANRIHTDEILNGIYWIQLEKGNKATDWSPASEDLTSKSEFATFEATMKGFQTTVNSDITGLQSQQTQMDGQITNVVKDVDGNKTQITQLKSDINLRVEKANVIAQINLSPEQVLIQAKRIHLSGESLIDNAVIKSAHIQDGSITNAKIQDATIDSAKINSIDASKINAQTLQSITSNTGQLNVTGWLDFTTENRGLRGSYDFGDPYQGAYNFRWFDGDFRLSHRHLIYGGNIHEVTSGNSKGNKIGRAETFYGLDYAKFRSWNNSNIMTGRVDLTAQYLSMSTAFDDNINVMIKSDGTAYFNNDVTVTSDIIMRSDKTLFTYNVQSLPLGSNIYFNYSRTDLADFRIGKDGSAINGGRLVKSNAIYNRTYSGVANMTVTTDGTLGRVTSAKKYKLDIEIANEVIAGAKRVLSLNPKSWYDKGEILDGVANSRYYGFIADEFDEIGLKQVVIYNEHNEVESLAYDRISMYHNVILSEHENELTLLKRKIKILEDRLHA